MINKTGRPEHLTPSGSDGGDVLNTLRRIERLLGAWERLSEEQRERTRVLARCVLAAYFAARDRKEPV